ncbi:aminoglycoside adenylyltransferase family protein [Corallococcus macrosporus]|uniref:Aminoglycoside nucleotidyltransferase ANT9 n=1 Tax=Corallococcus macrosporus DSM 14697 TaxID=1189310 RepID=A0A250K0G1_9BACT|nr:aminoglycoside adenylyltransferase family protein [Corallococcus macrosporus]ATB49599.1 aminoglycoside nucleotidyltransferase ANT9 [Corallococcus macrosporus DSM 14697]
MNASLPADIAQQVSSACSVIGQRLARSLQAIHLFGSAVDGGLRPQSDIDLLVTVSAPLPDAIRGALMRDLLTVSAWPVTRESLRPLEVTVVVRDAVVPWRYPPMRELQFGEWLRAELEAGHVHPAVVDHDVAILLTKARQHSVCLHGAPAIELFDPVPRVDLARALYDTVLQWNEPADWRGDERNVVLALARIGFSLSTGAIAPKDVAAQRAMERLPDEHRAVMRDARAAYLGAAQDDLASRGPEVTAFVRYARATLEEMYRALQADLSSPRGTQRNT